MECDVSPVKEEIAQSLFDHIPVGVGSKGVIPTTAADLEEVNTSRILWFQYVYSTRSLLRCCY